MSAARCQKMREKLIAAFNPEILNIIDESHLHAGHAGNTGKKGHFAIEIKAQAFQNKKLLETHRAIYNALGDMMENDIHALSIKTL